MTGRNYSSETTTDIGAAIDAGINLADSFWICETPAVMVPEGAQIKTYPELTEKPGRIQQEVKLTTLASFLAYYTEHDLDTTAVFCNVDQGKFTAIFDYHGRDDPKWGSHRALYTCPQTKEWGAWSAGNNKHFSQEEFCEFIEQNFADIRNPTGAQMLEIAGTIAAKNEVTFRRALRLDNGQIQLKYDNLVTGSAGEHGQFEIPEKIILGIRVFKDGEAYEIDARFRYRLSANGKITLWYEMIRPDRVYEDAVNNVYKAIVEKIDNTRIYQGSP